MKVAAYSIVFVHIGKQLPVYLDDALLQARLFNKDCKIYLIANQQALEQHRFDCSIELSIVPIETLRRTKAHQDFIKGSTLDRNNSNGFWFYASERFLYLDDFMQQFNVEHVFHLESDNMLYVDLSELMPVFIEKYPGIAATFDNDDRCIPGFVYIANKEVMHELAQCFAHYACHGKSDMEVLAIFKKIHGSGVIENLPIIIDSYRKKFGLKSTTGRVPLDRFAYSKNLNDFNSVFDAAALGQYLGGKDKIHKDPEPGFINESCLFNPSRCSYIWQVDACKRKVPYIVFGHEVYRINNFHVHSKDLKKFSSI